MNNKVQINNLVKDQQPNFVKESYPDFIQFLKDYYKSLEYTSGPIDILNNINEYTRLENLSELIFYTELSSDLAFNKTTINVSDTSGFPLVNGFIKIDDEIILYERKNNTQFLGCKRGFSGVSDFKSKSLNFETTLRSDHTGGSTVYNINSLFLLELYKKFKIQHTPGFEDVDFYGDLNERILVSRIKDFYASKGSDKSFEVLFKVVWGVESKVIKPRDFILQSSDADYRIIRELVVERYEGDPKDLEGRTIFEDIDGIVGSSFGTIVSVESILKGGKEYFFLILDYDPEIEEYNFNIHPKTKLTDRCFIGQNYISVDSTIGFPEQGTIQFYDNAGVLYSVEYTSKNICQFFGFSLPVNLDYGVDVFTPDYAYAFDDNNNQIKVKITGVLGELEYDQKDSRYYQPEDTIDIISLGQESEDPINSYWFRNICPRYSIASLFKVTEKLNGISQYRTTVFDEHILKVGDFCTLSSNDGIEYDVSVISVSSKTSFDINTPVVLDESKTYSIKKNLTKANTLNNQDLNIIASDVHNVYLNKDETYVASSSLPSYYERAVVFDKVSITFSVSISTPTVDIVVGNHPFITGDSIFYSYNGNFGLNIEEGQYFVYRVNDSTIRLSSSRSNIRSERFLEIFGTCTNNKIGLLKYNTKEIKENYQIKKFVPPVDDSTIEERVTFPGPTGMFLNGIELLNYKSSDTVYYGPINSIIVSSSGSDYDVINPPVLEIVDNIGEPGESGFGTDAIGVCNVIGSLKRIDVFDTGFDYTKEPRVTISGGNGFGAEAKCNLTSIKHFVQFNSNQIYNQVNIDNNSIGFGTYHRFRNYEQVIYNSDNQSEIGGLVDGSIYYIGLIDSNTIRLHNSLSDSISGINTISFTDYGDGLHKLTTTGSKKIVTSIDIINPGSNYTNKTLFFNSNDISPSFDIIKLPNHGYNNKEIVMFSTEGTLPTGITSTKKYYVQPINSDEIRTYELLEDRVDSDYNYTNKIINKISNDGDGLHSVTYTPISVKVEAPIGISSDIGQNFSAVLKPVFAGEILSVSMKDQGSNYGDKTIINYNRQPNIILRSGSGANLVPIISKQNKIVGVKIINGGSGYNSIPKINVSGSGSNASLVPVIKNGSIDDVKILNGGTGYTKESTSIQVLSNGSGAQLRANIKNWTINLVERLFYSNNVQNDDGVLFESLKGDTLQYCHAYASRGIREQTLASSLDVDGNPIFKADILNDDDPIKYHSPIIGWAYDGNPIYGPYGYDQIEGGEIRQLKSSYEIDVKLNRPPTSIFPIGIFTEDYKYTNSGDLDESNGRFCKTPEFPNGVYAYFATFNTIKESIGSYVGFKKPAFPYVIGQNYKSKPIEYNFNKIIRTIDQNNWIRLTNNLGLLGGDQTFYNSINQPEIFTSVLPKVGAVTRGSVDSLQIINGGNNYRVGDDIYFNNENTFGAGAFAKVKRILGKTLSSLSYDLTSYDKVYFEKKDNSNSFIGYADTTHNLLDNDIIIIDGNNQYSTKFDGAVQTKIPKANTLVIVSDIEDISTTGIITYINVTGKLDSSSIVIGDFYESNNEKFKVLNVYPNISKLRVERSYFGSISSTHAVGDLFEELNRKIIINSGFTTESSYSLNYNYNFNPKEYVITSSENLLQYSSPIPLSQLPTTPWRTFDTGNLGSVVYFEDSPIATDTAAKVSISSTIGASDGFSFGYENVSLSAGLNTFSVFLKGQNGGESIYLIVDDTLLYSGELVTLTDEWKRYTFTVNISSGGQHNVSVGANGIYGFQLNDTPTFYLWGAQIESGKFATQYYENFNSTVTRTDNKSGLFHLDNPSERSLFLSETFPNTIYAPNHKFKTNDSVIYDFIGVGASGINVSYGSTSEELTNSYELNVIVYNSNFIGLSTQKVGIGSTQRFIGVGSNTFSPLMLNDYGIGDNHSLITNKDNVLYSTVSKVTATAESLEDDIDVIPGDIVTVNAKSSAQDIIKISYDDVVKRILVNAVEFLGTDIDLSTKYINIPEHKFKTGDKVIYNSNNPSGELENSAVYYIIKIDSNNIALSNNYYSTISSLKLIPGSNIIDILTQEDGQLSLVNPEIKIYKNNIIKFDLSSRSLQFNENPSFTFDIYYDSDFKEKYYTSSQSNNTFNVFKSGEIGSDNAYVELKIDDNTPKNLFYRITPIRLNTTPSAKLDIRIDSFNVVNRCRLTLIDSVYSGNYSITEVTANTFSYLLKSIPEPIIYNNNTSILNYSTESTSAVGPISEVSLISKGRNYEKLPYVSQVVSGIGTNAIFLPTSNTIGKVESIVLDDIGFGYASDKTLRPRVRFPITYKVEPLSKFKRIKIVDFGVNYFVTPQLVVIDGFTSRVNDEVQLKYDLGDTDVSILRNTTGLYNVTPKIIPVNNPNGIRIQNIVFDPLTSDVTVSLAVTFSSEQLFPFNVGDKVIVENTNVDLNIGGKGYNSAAYNYKLFELKAVDPDVGGENPNVVYSLINDIPVGSNPGVFDQFESFGTITPQSYFPIFDIELEKDTFIVGEVVEYEGNTGIVQSYDPFNEYIRISSKKSFSVGDVIYGRSSKNLALLSNVSGIEGNFITSSNSIVRRGWRKDTGKLNNTNQRLHDNDYYQYFSYAIKSPIEFEEWNPIVSNLTHTTGFKKFGQFTLDSYDPNIKPMNTEQNENVVVAISNLTQEVNLNSIKDFDTAREKSILVDDLYVSNEILFNLPFLAEYQEFIGNRVLTIDDISENFDGNSTSFELYEKNNPIFSIPFDASNSDTVLLSQNNINLTNHYFVTGEEVEYIPHNGDPNNSIQISPIDWPGIGVTSRLPSRFYIIKEDNQRISIAATIGDALSFNVSRVNLIGLGAGTDHKIMSIDANNRLLIAINGSIQSPIVGSGYTIATSPTGNIGIGDTDISTDTVESINSGDLLKIDNEILSVNSVQSSTNTINVKRASLGTDESTHNSNTIISKLSGNFNIVGNTINFSEPIWGKIPVGFGTTATSLNDIDYTGLTTSSRFSGRVFLRSALNFLYTTDYTQAYDNNYVYDDISLGFDGISTTFNLRYDGNSIDDILYTNTIILIDGIFQGPQRISTPQSLIPGDYKLFVDGGDLKVGFNINPVDPTITKDVNVNRLPKGGIIVSVGSSAGFGYQPLVSAGGTALINLSGGLDSISIGNTGSGYRSGLQTVNVGLRTNSNEVIYFGEAVVSDGYVTSVNITNPPPTIYDQSNPPEVIFDAPLNYTNLPLIYSEGSSGIGTEATVDLIPSNDGTIRSFEIKNNGYGYVEGDKLTVSIGGTVGIQTLTGIANFDPFELFITEVFRSQFSGWNVGEFLVLDDISKYFNGVRRLFPLQIDGEDISFYAKTSSGISLQSNLLVFVNGILQTPGEGYTFNGGSRVRFSEAPKGPDVGFSTVGDTVKLLVYTGTSEIDVKSVKVLPTVKVGDTVQLYSNIDSIYTQNERLVLDIKSADTIITNNYADIGVVSDELYERPISWFKQTTDIIIDNQYVGKDRVYYEPIINPSTNIISPIGIASDFVYVNNLVRLFNSSEEGISPEEQKTIEILSNGSSLSSASAVAVLDQSGGVDSIIVTNPGYGYTSAPTVTVQNPYFDGSQATANASINSNGQVTSISVGFGGTNYYGGPIKQLEVISQGTGFPGISATTSILTGARLFTETGRGTNATVNITINPENQSVSSIAINEGGKDYSVNDVLKLYVYDNVGLAASYRRWPLQTPISFRVTEIEPPEVLIAPPSRISEEVTFVNYYGDNGVIVGITTLTPSGLNYYVDLDLFIPMDSKLREREGKYNSGITTGDFFTISNTVFGSSPRTSRDTKGISVGISTVNSDCVVYCYDWSEVSGVTIPAGLSGLNVGITTTVRRVSVIFTRTGLGMDAMGSSTIDFYGNYDWGKIDLSRRPFPQTFDIVTPISTPNINSHTLIRRKFPLKYDGYFV
jgi:hypothetical protein